MSYGVNFSPILSQPYHRPCIIVPNPDSYAYCGKPSGFHTALDYPICDECHSFISAEGLVAGPPVAILGGA